MTPKTSKIGIIPIPFENRIKKKNVNINGVQVLTHFSPTFGLTIESLINWTMASMAFNQPEGMADLLFKNDLIGIIIDSETTIATSHNIKTCFVTERFIPAIVGS